MPITRGWLVAGIALIAMSISCCISRPRSEDALPPPTPQPPLAVTIPSTHQTPNSIQEFADSTSDLSSKQRDRSPSRTPLPTRDRWEYGDILPYTVQSGDTIASLASHFNLTPDKLLNANPGLTIYSTTLPPGRKLAIPARFIPHLGTSFKIIPDSELVYGPAQQGLDLQDIIQHHGGWLAKRSNRDEVLEYQRWDLMQPSWVILHQVALNYSINPRLLLALLEFRSGIVTSAFPDISVARDPLILNNTSYNGIANQLNWAAEMLSTGYYGWRSGKLTEVILADGRVSRIDPWQNAATAALHYLFGALYESDDFKHATNPEGFSATYQTLFGDPFTLEKIIMPANLQQPPFVLPFQPGVIWSFTGGPHAAWGDAIPWAAIDFAPPSASGECGRSNAWATAVAAGIVARSHEAAVVLDLDGDGNEHTGWSVFYYHLRSDSLPEVGTVLEAGDPIGHPSCEGGRVTGTHLHIGRKYNGEWIEADGPIPLTLSGWVIHAESEPYKGRLTHDLPAQEIVACECVSKQNMISR